MNNDDTQKLNSKHNLQKGGIRPVPQLDKNYNPPDDGINAMNDPKFNIPEYREPRNNPMIPNEQKRIYTENRQYKQPDDPNRNQILNLQLFQPQKQKPTNSQGQQFPNPAVFYPNYAPNPYNPYNPYNPINYSQYQYNPFGYIQPVYKEYNVNIGGVTGSHTRTAIFFEDALPIKNVSASFNSISERTTLYESIRSNMFSTGDGKDVPIENGSYGILSHLKLNDMNPYNASKFSNNPYKGLPFGFLLYRSCYPMRHDRRGHDSLCATNSIGVNIRIYRLTEGGYLVNKQDITKADDHDEWREIGFYNFIKEHILKKKVCPHFPYMYGYNITLNANINFDELKKLSESIQNKQPIKTDGTTFKTMTGKLIQTGVPIPNKPTNNSTVLISNH